MITKHNFMAAIDLCGAKFARGGTSFPKTWRCRIEIGIA